MALIRCPDCNQAVSSHATHCPNCGCPIETIKAESSLIRRRKFQKIILILASIIACFACVIALYYNIPKLLRPGYYNSFKWGTSFESLQKRYPEDASYEGNQSGEIFSRLGDSFENISNLITVESYSFNDEKLYSVSIVIGPSDTSDLTYQQLAETIIEKYARYYGEAECSENRILNGKIYKWHTSKSNITLYTCSPIMIDYEDLNYTDLSSNRI